MTDEEKALARSERRWQRLQGEIRWVQGYITHNGAIFGTATKDCQIHPDEEKLSGHTWRWNVVRQEWAEYATGNMHLTAEETMLVLDWLEREGHKDLEDRE